MYIFIKENNTSELDNYFLKKNEVEKELKHNPFGSYLCYKEHNKIIGYLYYSDIYNRCEINQIEVEVFHRNRGIATKMLKKLLETVKKDITLEVNVENQIAIALYRKEGFIPQAIRKKYYNGIDGILMKRENK